MSDVRSEMQALADYLGRQASERFEAFGPRDPRGAALWDVAAYIEETVIPKIDREETP